MSSCPWPQAHLILAHHPIHPLHPISFPLRGVGAVRSHETACAHHPNLTNYVKPVVSSLLGPFSMTIFKLIYETIHCYCNSSHLLLFL